MIRQGESFIPILTRILFALLSRKPRNPAFRTPRSALGIIKGGALASCAWRKSFVR